MWDKIRSRKKTGNIKGLLQILCLLILSLALISCGGKEGKKEEEEGYRLYFVNSEQTKVVSMPFSTQTRDT